MKTLKLFICTLATLATLSSCSPAKFIKAQTHTFELSCSAHPENRYNNLTYGLKLNVSSSVQNGQILDISELTGFSKQIANKNTYIFTPTIQEFVHESMSTYIRSMGIELGDVDNSYTLNVKIKEFKLVDSNSGAARATIILDYTLISRDNQTIIRNTARGRYQLSPGQGVVEGLDKAYSKALKNIDWNNIATQLRISRRADLEPNKQVKGDGDTALEHQVITCNISSRPEGADLEWQIVSRTPDVKGSNRVYLETTNFTGTQAFNIKGLSHTNSGNVDLVIYCIKDGYYAKSQRFNLRSLIDQPEISTMFRLVKEDEE